MYVAYLLNNYQVCYNYAPRGQKLALPQISHVLHGLKKWLWILYPVDIVYP